MPTDTSDTSPSPADLHQTILDEFGSIGEFLAHGDVEVDWDSLHAHLGRPTALSERERPSTLHGVSQRINTGYGHLYVTINEEPETGTPFEVFATIGSSGGFSASFAEALAKTMSTALRAGVEPQEIIDALSGIRSPKVDWDNGDRIDSIPDAMATAFRRHYHNELKSLPSGQTTLAGAARDSTSSPSETTPNSSPNTESDPEIPESSESDAQPPTEQASESESRASPSRTDSVVCPDCGSVEIHRSEGCKTCECGWSEC